MKRKVWIFLLIGVIALCAIIGLFTWNKQKGSSSQLPSDILSQVTTFTPYYYIKDPPKGFQLDQKSVIYSQGNLFFNLINKDGQTVTVTQQALPDSFTDSIIQGKEKVGGTAGEATISYDGARSIGYLVPKDKSAFILLNSVSVDADAMKSLMQLLKPVR